MCDMFRPVESKLGDTNAIWVFRSFQYGRQFSRWPPLAILKPIFSLKMTVNCLKTRFCQLVICAEYVESAVNVISTILNVQLVPIWPPISKMAAIGYHTRVCLKMAAGSQKDDLGISDIFEHVKGEIDWTNYIQVFGSFQYGRQFSRWPQWTNPKYYQLLWELQRSVENDDVEKLICV